MNLDLIAILVSALNIAVLGLIVYLIIKAIKLINLATDYLKKKNDTEK